MSLPITRAGIEVGNGSPIAAGGYPALINLNGSHMTTAQYRCLIAYMNFWTPRFPQMNFDVAISDCGITDSKESVVNALFTAGWNYDEATGLLSYEDD